MHERNSFLTLTYSDEFLPKDGNLRYGDFQKFCKRVRKVCGPFRFYMCGEYGDKDRRPHYHCILFGLDFFEDRQVWKRGSGGTLYRSELLETLWPYGHSLIGAFSFESAAYVARYVMKKVTGDAARDHYKVVDEDTGEVTWLTPEFTRMSLKPGIGATFFDQFHKDIFPGDFVVSRAMKVRPPRYYDKRLKRMDPLLYADVKAQREFDSAVVTIESDEELNSRVVVDEVQAYERTPERLAVREAVASAALSSKKRSL